ncbi:MAG: cupin domain-containing protein [Bacteroidota bacterium]
MIGKFFTSDHLFWNSSDVGKAIQHSSPSLTDSGQLLVIEVEILPGKSHGFHRHPNQEEVIYVIEGTIQQWIEDTSVNLTQGESAFIPTNIVHATFNTTDSPARFIAILSPCIGESGYEIQEVQQEQPWKDLGPF